MRDLEFVFSNRGTPNESCQAINILSATGMIKFIRFSPAAKGGDPKIFDIYFSLSWLVILGVYIMRSGVA